VSPFNLSGASFGGLYLPNTPLNPIWTKKPQEEEEEEEEKKIILLFFSSLLLLVSYTKMYNNS